MKNAICLLGAGAVGFLVAIVSPQSTSAASSLVLAGLGEKCKSPCVSTLCGGTKGCNCTTTSGIHFCEQNAQVVPVFTVDEVSTEILSTQ